MSVTRVDESAAFDRAKVKLARLRERYQPDREGRQRAATNLLNRLAEACSAAGLVLRHEAGFLRVGLRHRPQAEVTVSPSAGGLVVQRDFAISEVPGLEFDPVHGTYVGSGENGAIELVASVLISELQTKAAAAGR